MRHQWASVHELARIEMLAGLPGQTLGRLAERMERRALSPGQQLDVEGRLVAVLNGLARATDACGERTTIEPGTVVDAAAVGLRALTPVTIASCPRAVYEELVEATADAQVRDHGRAAGG